MRLASLLLLLTWSACGPAEKPEPTFQNVPFTEEGLLRFERAGVPMVEVKIEIADDDSSRARGLMQRTSMPERSGMLFVFPVEAPQSFWMANTQMSLDLVFVSAAGSVVSISKYAKPLSTEPVMSVGPALYVIEFEAGFADTWGLIEGDTVAWERY